MVAKSQENNTVARAYVRLLGPLSVTLADGTVIDSAAWRTGKTMDLLRLLALGDGAPVRRTYLIDQLWPDVPIARGQGSLRTAASQIRHVLPFDSVERRLDGLVLNHVEIDISRYLDYAHQIHKAESHLDHAAVIALNRTAQHLYQDDFHAQDDEAVWVHEERQRLIRVRLKMLLSAACAAMETKQFSEALDLARTITDSDPISETAHRIVMICLAELGEVSGALRAFADCRRRIAEELGTEPSPETVALHLDLLLHRRV